MNEIKKAIRHFKNAKEKNFVILNDFIKEIEMKKAIGNNNINYNTSIYENRDKYYDLAIKALEQQLNSSWIPLKDRLPTREEYNKNDGRFIVTDGIRRYQRLFDIYETNKFVDITHIGNCDFKETIDRTVIAWQELPEKYIEESK